MGCSLRSDFSPHVCAPYLKVRRIGDKLEDSWKPKAWLSIFYGLVIQPFTFLYVNKAKLFWFYLILIIFVTLIDTKLQAIDDTESWHHNIYFTWLFLIICPIHAYLICRGYDKGQRKKWYAGWLATLVCFVMFFAFLSLVRAFIYEPFSIPARSMSPTLNPGDQVIVSKSGFGNYRYFGLQIVKKAPSKTLKRGNVVVFQYPQNPQIDFVKRVIGLPGDTVIYRDKSIFIKPSCMDESANCPGFTEVAKEYKFTDSGAGSEHEYYKESLDNDSYVIKLNNNQKDLSERYFYQVGTQTDEWLVPDKHYFVLGDNRDNSLDSRYWGFVPESNIIGKIAYVW